MDKLIEKISNFCEGRKCSDCPFDKDGKAIAIIDTYGGCDFYDMSEDELKYLVDLIEKTPKKIQVKLGVEMIRKPIDYDPVNKPAHYNDGKIEVIDYIEDKKLDFCLGNAVKYISRAGKKDKAKEVEDLNKAIWYINRKIQQLEKEGAVNA